MKLEKQKTWKIEVVDNIYTDTFDEPTDPDDEYARASTYETHDIQGIKLSKYGDIEIDFEPKYDVTYFLVIVNYDTGDSFGRDNGRVSYVDLFKNEKLADN
jgi:hypothetical protein